MFRRCERGGGRTKSRVLNAAKTLFARRGIDRVTIVQIAKKAEVAAPTVYALYKSKEGMLRGLMSAALFGSRFQEAQAKLAGVTDPVRLITLTAHVARAIYEGESSELGLMRGASAFSPALRKLEAGIRENPVRNAGGTRQAAVRPLQAAQAASDWTKPGESSGCTRAATSIACCQEGGWTPGPVSAMAVGHAGERIGPKRLMAPS